MAFIDQSLIRECNKQHHYCEPDAIRLEPAFTEEYKQHFRWVMVRRFKALLEKKPGWRKRIEGISLGGVVPLMSEKIDA